MCYLVRYNNGMMYIAGEVTCEVCYLVRYNNGTMYIAGEVTCEVCCLVRYNNGMMCGKPNVMYSIGYAQ